MADDGWTSGGTDGVDKAILTVIAGAQFARSISHQIKVGDRLTRFNQARQYVSEKALARLRDAEETLKEAHIQIDDLHLEKDNSALLANAFNDQDRLGLLITGLLGNPIQPFQVEVPEKARQAALAEFADDLGCPRNWAPAVTRAVHDALKTQASIGPLALKVGVALLGVAIIAAAPLLVVAVGGSSLAGAAVIVSGLAALGPGGMLGGLAVVGAVAAGGGGMAAASLVTGNRKTVQQNVVFIHALALAKRELRPHPRSRDEWATLDKMSRELQQSLEEHKRADDPLAPTRKDIKNKLADVDRALKALEDAGIGGKL